MYAPITFVDDTLGTIRVNENAILFMVQDGTIIRAKYQTGKYAPKDDRLEEDLIDSRDSTDMTTIAAASNVLIEVTGASGEFDGLDLAVNANAIRTYYGVTGGTKIVLEKTSIRPLELIVDESESAIDTLIGNKFDAMITDPV